MTKEQLQFRGKVKQEVYDRVMRVFKNDRQISNPEELLHAIFGHPNVQIAFEEAIIPEQIPMGTSKKEFNPSKKICCGVPMRKVELRPGKFGYKCDECLTLMEERK